MHWYSNWHGKLKHMRKKMKGWHKNFLAAKKKKKIQALTTLQSLIKIKEQRDLSGQKAQIWLEIKKHY
jgi:uncharacterized membrane protein (DUF106 family)